jgi:hypothetical protein
MFLSVVHGGRRAGARSAAPKVARERPSDGDDAHSARPRAETASPAGAPVEAAARRAVTAREFLLRAVHAIEPERPRNVRVLVIAVSVDEIGDLMPQHGEVHCLDNMGAEMARDVLQQALAGLGGAAEVVDRRPS